MKKLNLMRQDGFAQVFVLVGMLLVAISLPITTKLVQQNQENRSNAITSRCSSGETKCTDGYKYTCNNSNWKKTTTKCTKKTTVTTPKKTTTATTVKTATGCTSLTTSKACEDYGCNWNSSTKKCGTTTKTTTTTKDCVCGTTEGTC